MSKRKNDIQIDRVIEQFNERDILAKIKPKLEYEESPSTSAQSLYNEEHKEFKPEAYEILEVEEQSVTSVSCGSLSKSIATQTDFYYENNEIQQLRDEVKAEMKCIRDDIYGLKRSVLYHINKLDEKLSFHFMHQNNDGNNGISLAEMKCKLNLEKPIEDLKMFYEFDKKIATDKECAAVFRELLSFKTRAKTLHEAINGVMSLVMSQELHLLFSGCGKPNKGVAKENFSATQTYKELKDQLISQFTNETEATILSKTSRWLTGAKERSGGRVR